MTPENFCYWLQGWFELNQTLYYQGATEDTLKMIEDHLKLVFNKVTHSVVTPGVVTPDVGAPNINISAPPDYDYIKP